MMPRLRSSASATRRRRAAEHDRLHEDAGQQVARVARSRHVIAPPKTKRKSSTNMTGWIVENTSSCGVRRMAAGCARDHDGIGEAAEAGRRAGGRPAVRALTPPPPRAPRGCAAARQREEDVVERRAAQAEVARHDALLVERAHGAHQVGRALVTRQRDATRRPRRARLAAADAAQREQLRRARQLRGVGEPSSSTSAPMPRLELARRAVRDHLAVVDDDDVVGQVVGLLEVLRRQQHASCRRRRARG